MNISRRRLVMALAGAPVYMALLETRPAWAGSTSTASPVSSAVRTLVALANTRQDATGALQSLVDAATAHGLAASVPAGTYMIDPDVGVSLRSDTMLALSAQTRLAAFPSRKRGYSVLKLWGIDKASVTGGQIVGERDHHLGHGGEWGMGVDIRGSTNISISGINVSDCWGDGLYVGMGTKNHEPCRNVTLDHVTSTGNRRQGLSIVDCIGAQILNSTFRGTHGTPPQAGIDLEPDGASPVSNILIRNCVATENAGVGIQTANHARNVRVENCQISGNDRGGIALGGTVDGVTLLDNTITSSRGYGVYIGKDVTNYALKQNTIHTTGPTPKLKVDGKR